MVRLGEWSVRARYSRPRSFAASAMRGMGDPPSDQSLWLWRSPRRDAVELSPAVGKRCRAALAQVLQVVGHLAVHRLADHLVRPVADPLHAFEPAVPGPGFHLGGVQGGDDAGCLPESLDLEGGSASALQPKGDLVERSDGIHLSIFACYGRFR